MLAGIDLQTRLPVGAPGVCSQSGEKERAALSSCCHCLTGVYPSLSAQRRTARGSHGWVMRGPTFALTGPLPRGHHPPIVCLSATLVPPLRTSWIPSISRRHLFFSLPRDPLGAQRNLCVWSLDSPWSPGWRVRGTLRQAKPKPVRPPVLGSGLLGPHLRGSSESRRATSLLSESPTLDTLWDFLQQLNSHLGTWGQEQQPVCKAPGRLVYLCVYLYWEGWEKLRGLWIFTGTLLQGGNEIIPSPLHSRC